MPLVKDMLGARDNTASGKSHFLSPRVQPTLKTAHQALVGVVIL